MDRICAFISGLNKKSKLCWLNKEKIKKKLNREKKFTRGITPKQYFKKLFNFGNK